MTSVSVLLFLSPRSIIYEKWLSMLVAYVEIEMYVGDRFDRFYQHQLCRQHHFVAKNDLPFVHIISEYKQVTTKPVK